MSLQYCVFGRSGGPSDASSGRVPIQTQSSRATLGPRPSSLLCIPSGVKIRSRLSSTNSESPRWWAGVGVWVRCWGGVVVGEQW